jgi:starch phosphorylase
VVPLFYNRDDEDVPRGWVAKMKASMRRLTPIYNTNRMVAEYAERFYLPASARHLRLRADNAARVRPLVEWRKRIRDHGSEVKIVEVDCQSTKEVFVGAALKITARIFLGSLEPGDVRPQIYYGAVDPAGQITHGKVVDMMYAGQVDGDHRYQGSVECGDSGSCGFSARVTAFHEDAIVPYEQPWVVWQE